MNQDLRAVKIEGKECNYTALAFAALKRVCWGLFPVLKDNGDFDDLTQDARLAAVEAANRELDPKQAYNLAQSRIYSGLKACGYHREHVATGKSGRWERRTTKLDEFE